MDLGTLVPYISPPLIHARLPGKIKESKRHLCLRRLTGGSLGGFKNPLMRSQKACCPGPFGSTVIITWWFVNRAGRMLVGIGIRKVFLLTKPHYGWLDAASLSLASINRSSQIIFSLSHSLLSKLSLYRAFICALIHQSRALFFPKAQSKFPTSSFYFSFFLRVYFFNFRL